MSTLLGIAFLIAYIWIISKLCFNPRLAPESVKAYFRSRW